MSRLRLSNMFYVAAYMSSSPLPGGCTVCGGMKQLARYHASWDVGFYKEYPRPVSPASRIR